MKFSDGINSDKTSLPANDNTQNENENTQKPGDQHTDKDNREDAGKSAIKGNYRPSSKKAGKQQPVKKNGDHTNDEREESGREESGNELGDETEIADETTI